MPVAQKGGFAMDIDENTTILAVPCDQPVILAREHGEALLAEIKNKNTSKEEKERISSSVKKMFAKPCNK